jgi:predicted transcriptional regulator
MQNFQEMISTIVDRSGGQSQAAELLGVCQPTIHRYLDGREPKAKTVSLLADRIIKARRWSK